MLPLEWFLTDTTLTVAGNVRAKKFIANCASLNLKGDLIHINKRQTQ